MNQIKVSLSTLLLTFCLSCSAQDAPFYAVQEFFAALSVPDQAKMRALVTEDFQLLEQGEDWRLDDLLKLLKPSDTKRRNFFNVVRSEVTGDVAWVSYWNRAVITNAEKSRAVVWLESAVLRKQNGVWKIQMLHSTRLTTDKLPAGVTLTEYVPVQ